MTTIPQSTSLQRFTTPYSPAHGYIPPPATYKWKPFTASPHSFFVIPFKGEKRVVIGGGFNAHKTGAIGVCLNEFASKDKIKEADVFLPIHDFGVPDKDAISWAVAHTMYLMHKRRQVPLYVGCAGGKGRTGLFLAILARAVLGVKDGVTWVRDNYSEEAVETQGQETFANSIDIELIRRRYRILYFKTPLSKAKKRLFSFIPRL